MTNTAEGRPSLEQMLKDRLKMRISEALVGVANGEVSTANQELAQVVNGVKKKLGRVPTVDEVYNYIFGLDKEPGEA